ncbi:MAG: hypothetical protein LBK53_00505 [Heliobacteriaceae bacterium]|jgi:hypothetical protein|nr:hypothetical protein [Heliobacteriaceae bacterium]
MSVQAVGNGNQQSYAIPLGLTVIGAGTGLSIAGFSTPKDTAVFNKTEELALTNKATAQSNKFKALVTLATDGKAENLSDAVVKDLEELGFTKDGLKADGNKNKALEEAKKLYKAIAGEELPDDIKTVETSAFESKCTEYYVTNKTPQTLAKEVESLKQIAEVPKDIKLEDLQKLAKDKAELLGYKAQPEVKAVAADAANNIAEVKAVPAKSVEEVIAEELKTTGDAGKLKKRIADAIKNTEAKLNIVGGSETGEALVKKVADVADGKIKIKALSEVDEASKAMHGVVTDAYQACKKSLWKWGLGLAAAGAAVGLIIRSAMGSKKAS